MWAQIAQHRTPTLVLRPKPSNRLVGQEGGVAVFGLIAGRVAGDAAIGAGLGVIGGKEIVVMVKDIAPPPQLAQPSPVPAHHHAADIQPLKQSKPIAVQERRIIGVPMGRIGGGVGIAENCGGIANCAQMLGKGSVVFCQWRSVDDNAVGHAVKPSVHAGARRRAGDHLAVVIFKRDTIAHQRVEVWGQGRVHAQLIIAPLIGNDHQDVLAGVWGWHHRDSSSFLGNQSGIRSQGRSLVCMQNTAFSKAIPGWPRPSASLGDKPEERATPSRCPPICPY